jgi:hypothetical protein
VALIIGTALGAGAVGAVWALGGDDRAAADGRVVVAFEPGSAQDQRLIAPVVRRVAATVNAEVALPRDLRISVIGAATATKVDAPGPVYVPGTRTLYVPWSFVDEVRAELGNEQRAATRRAGGRLEDVVAAATAFVLYHEVAHGLIELLDLPVVGREETAADGLGAIFTIDTGGEARSDALAAGELFDALAHRGEVPIRIAGAGYDLSYQRYFDVLCKLYGSDPKRNADLVGGDHGITEDRAASCVFDYRRERRSWDRLLARWRP